MECGIYFRFLSRRLAMHVVVEDFHAKGEMDFFGNGEADVS